MSINERVSRWIDGVDGWMDEGMKVAYHVGNGADLGCHGARHLACIAKVTQLGHRIRRVGVERAQQHVAGLEVAVRVAVVVQVDHGRADVDADAIQQRPRRRQVLGALRRRRRRSKRTSEQIGRFQSMPGGGSGGSEGVSER